MDEADQDFFFPPPEKNGTGTKKNGTKIEIGARNTKIGEMSETGRGTKRERRGGGRERGKNRSDGKRKREKRKR